MQSYSYNVGLCATASPACNEVRVVSVSVSVSVNPCRSALRCEQTTRLSIGLTIHNDDSVVVSVSVAVNVSTSCRRSRNESTFYAGFADC